MKNINAKIFIVNAAGGNATAISILTGPCERDWYSSEGAKLIAQFEASHGVEQSGFLVFSDNHFEMAGGEFCGNAARSAAMLFSRLTGNNELSFTMSGYDGSVDATVQWTDDNKANVACVFTGLPSEFTNVTVLGNMPAKLVDLGGIVHVLIEDAFPDDYEVKHRQVMDELGLTERAAVGVNWLSSNNGATRLDPVVWVRSINSFFYESACGSGSIAAHVATGASEIEQPSGETIHVTRRGNVITLQSDMEITHAE